MATANCGKAGNLARFFSPGLGQLRLRQTALSRRFDEANVAWIDNNLVSNFHSNLIWQQKLRWLESNFHGDLTKQNVDSKRGGKSFDNDNGKNSPAKIRVFSPWRHLALSKTNLAIFSRNEVNNTFWFADFCLHFPWTFELLGLPRSWQDSKSTSTWSQFFAFHPGTHKPDPKSLKTTLFSKFLSNFWRANFHTSRCLRQRYQSLDSLDDILVIFWTITYSKDNFCFHETNFIDKLSSFLTKVSFDTSEGNQLSYFQNGYFFKILW